MDREKQGRHSSHTHHPQDQDRRDPRLSRNLGKYTCPMHPEVVSDQPGDCSKCGMALELIPTLVPRKGTIYTCPMHPQCNRIILVSARSVVCHSNSRPSTSKTKAK